MVQQDYAEILLNTIDVVIAERMRDQKFDETIICTITDTSKADKGLYTVSNGTIKFDAYSDITTYEVDEAVRVTIARGDYTQKKYIIGKAVSEKNGNQPIVYSAPSSQILNITGNIVSDNPKGGIIANAGSNNSEILIWSMELPDDYANSIYDSISLKANFRTFFDPYNVYRGEYGLYLRAAIRPQTKGGKWINRTYYLSSKDMFGDPYNYLIASSQEAKFGFDTNEQIAALSLYLYQENDFYYTDDSGISKLLPVNLTNNIEVSNIMIGLGTDLINVEDNKVVIYTEDDLVYNNANTENEKSISIVWYNKDENNKYIGFSDGIVDDKYDEKEYSKKLSNHERIAAQASKLDIPNDYAVYELTARMNEIAVASKELQKLINQDLYREIKAFKNAMNSIPNGGKPQDLNLNGGLDLDGDENLQNYFTAWLKTFENDQNVKNQLENLYNFYKEKLDIAAQVWNDSATAPAPEEWGTSLRKYENKLFGDITKGIEDAGSLYIYTVEGMASKLKDIQDWVGIIAPNYLGSCNNYRVRVEKLSKKIEQKALYLRDISLGHLYLMYSKLEPKDKDLDNSYFSSLGLFEKEEEDDKWALGLKYRLGSGQAGRKPYDAKAFDKYFKEESSNRYQIYWYYARAGYVPGKDENQFGGEGWCEIKDSDAINNISRFVVNNVISEKDNSIPNNIGLPKPDNGKYPPRGDSSDLNSYLSITFSAERPDIQEEKIKAVIIYNHEIYESNVLTFNNDDPAAGPELTNDIQITHGANSRDVYASYGVDNTLINATDFNTKRELKVQYLNERGEPESGDETALRDSTIYWYVPADATMIRLVDSDLSNFECGSAENRTFVYYKDVDSGEQKLLYKVNRIAISIKDGYKVVHNGKVYEGTLKEIAQAIKKAESVINTVTFTPITTTDGTRYDSQITYTYNINNNNGFISGLAYGGITYSLLVEKDNKYIISSDNIKYRIRDNIVTLPIDLPEDSDRAGFLYYYKTIKSNDDLTFTYRIKDYYSSSFSNNTIICKVVKNNQILESNISLDFNSMGSNGTHYTLVVKSRYDEAAMTQIKEIDGQQYYIYDFMIQLFDYENKQIPFNSVPSVTLDKLNDSTADISIEPNEGGAQSYYGTLKVPTANQPKAYMLKITTEKPWPVESTSVQLTQYYPIPWAKNSAYFAAVPTCIIYDSLGTNPSYYKDPLSLYISNESGTGNNPLVSECHWEIEGEYISIKKETANGKAQLAPCNMYITNFNSYPILKCYNNNNKNDILWYQPIYVGQNRYGSTLLNEWDGGLEISEKDGTIMSTMIGAGSKDNNNTFSGVLMGNVTQSTGIEVESEDQITVPHTGIGLYGFHEGAQSFGFNVNGTAFIGKSGGGRVAFDGNNGFIYSSNWLNSNEFKSNGKFNYSKAFPLGEDENTRTLGQGSAGMAIDLQNGHIDAYNFKLTGAGIELNANPSTGENHFIIGKKNDSKWVLDGTEPYLKYDANGNLEMKVNSLELTGTIGGPNLINNTAPREKATTEGLKYWWTPDWSLVTSTNCTLDGQKVKCIVLRKNDDKILSAEGKKYLKLVQKLNPDHYHSNQLEYTDIFRPGKYTFSCKVFIQDELPRPIIFRFGDTESDKVITYKFTDPNPSAGWNDIRFTIDIPENILYILNIYDELGLEKKEPLCFYHLKLERGTIASEWRASEQDIKDDYNESISLFDQQLNQNEIFNRLTNNGATKGIWLGDVTGDGVSDLYVNASYISTGILRSENWKGVIKLSGEEITYQEYLNLEDSQKPNAEIEASEGMYINLNNGKIWSKNFELNANWHGEFVVPGRDDKVAGESWINFNNNLNTNDYLFNIGYDLSTDQQNPSYIRLGVSGLQIKLSGGADLVIGNEDLNSRISATENKIMAQVSSKVDADGGSSTFSWSLTPKGFSLESNAKTVFSVNKYGAVVKGNIEAIRGSIGGWEISSKGLTGNTGGLLSTNADTNIGLSAMPESSANSPIRFYAGGSSPITRQEYNNSISVSGEPYEIKESISIGTKAFAKIESQEGVLKLEYEFEFYATYPGVSLDCTIPYNSNDISLAVTLYPPTKKYGIPVAPVKESNQWSIKRTIDDPGTWTLALFIERTKNNYSISKSRNTLNVSWKEQNDELKLTPTGSGVISDFSSEKPKKATLIYQFAAVFDPSDSSGPANAMFQVLDDGTVYSQAIQTTRIFFGVSGEKGPYIIENATGGTSRATLHGNWYASSGGIINSSSRNVKNNIELLDQRYIDLFDNLTPVRFKYNSPEAHRYHTGLILDELNEAMVKANLDSEELAAYCLHDRDNVNGEGGIRYEELIAILIAKLQQVDKNYQQLIEYITTMS